MTELFLWRGGVYALTGAKLKDYLLILASLRDALPFYAIPVVSLADSLYHRLQIHYPFGIKCAVR
jgi:hypothetical protein